MRFETEANQFSIAYLTSVRKSKRTSYVLGVHYHFEDSNLREEKKRNSFGFFFRALMFVCLVHGRQLVHACVCNLQIFNELSSLEKFTSINVNMCALFCGTAAIRKHRQSATLSHNFNALSRVKIHKKTRCRDWHCNAIGVWCRNLFTIQSKLGMCFKTLKIKVNMGSHLNICKLCVNANQPKYTYAHDRNKGELRERKKNNRNPV